MGRSVEVQLSCSEGSPTLPFDDRDSGAEEQAPQRGSGGDGHEDKPVAGDPRPQIPAGNYEAMCERTEITFYRNQRKLKFWFTIDKGEYAGANVTMFCPYPKGTKSSASKYYQQWVLATGRAPQKGQKLDRAVFDTHRFLVKIRSTNRKFSDEERMPDSVQYSVVESIIRLNDPPSADDLPWDENNRLSGRGE
jgi:hypothetical protein